MEKVLHTACLYPPIPQMRRLWSNGISWASGPQEKQVFLDGSQYAGPTKGGTAWNICPACRARPICPSGHDKRPSPPAPELSEPREVISEQGTAGGSAGLGSRPLISDFPARPLLFGLRTLCSSPRVAIHHCGLCQPGRPQPSGQKEEASTRAGGWGVKDTQCPSSA